MDSVDLSVLESVLNWRKQNFAVTLVTVVETWGSAPRPPGALLAVREDGVVAGSVSGGCVEDDLIERIKKREEKITHPGLIAYGVTKEEAARFGLPCGGSLRLVQEPVLDTAWINDLLTRCAQHQLVARHLNLSTGLTTLSAAKRGDELFFDGQILKTIHGPRWRLLIIGGGQLSRYVASMAKSLDYEVLMCDPREEYALEWDASLGQKLAGMPDDVVSELSLDVHSAVVALTHDPKLDDMALLEALKSKAFYVGALGSRSNTVKRKERMALFELSEAEIARLHGPIGLDIGSKTPAEIAVSIVAEITAVKNGITLTQKKAALDDAASAATGTTGAVCGVSA